MTLDETPSAALGVMSQGELFSPALTHFLPRATLPESPFRRTRDLPGRLHRLDPAADRVLKTANAAAHGSLPPPKSQTELLGLVEDAQRMVERLSRA